MSLHAIPISLLLVLALTAALAARGAEAPGGEAAAARSGPPAQETAAASRPAWIDASIQRLEAGLVAARGEGIRDRLARGLRQVASLWRDEDGGAEVFEAFVRENFAADDASRHTLLRRLDEVHEQLDGHLLEIERELRRPTDLDLGPILPADRILAGYDVGSHLADDLFANKIAFVVLLNFPLATLAEKLEAGDTWTREQWASVRLAERYGRRVPAAVQQRIAAATADAETYIAGYNIWMHHVLAEDGTRLFPPGMRLIVHWNLRDELKADYAEDDPLPRQRMIQKIMESIITQTIPRVVIDDPRADWKPVSNTVAPAAVRDWEDAPGGERRPTPGRAVAMGNESKGAGAIGGETGGAMGRALAAVAAGATTDFGRPSPAREPDTRYERLLAIFQAQRLADPFSPAAPTLIARRFDEDREIPEERVEAMLRELLSSPLLARVAKLIEERLGRPLEPFDIWYDGFKPRGRYGEDELSAITRERYPTAEAFAADIPSILEKLGFAPERARYVADRVVVDPARGAGHAMGAQRRGDKAHLRTRVGAGGMDYKGYNIAVHELGHNVEQTFSLYDVDWNALEGVPNTAFTEALAFVFQERDLELLGLATPDETSRALATLDGYWGACEIGAVALVDMGVWRWMYAHPGATPALLREATIAIAKDIWNEFFAPVFGIRDSVLLAVYSHMIDGTLYLPDYPIGHMIAHQIEERMHGAGRIGPEFERMAVQGRLTPDLWMRGATGAPVGPEALLEATRKALETVQAPGGRGTGDG